MRAADDLLDRIKRTLGPAFEGGQDWRSEIASDGRPVWHARDPERGEVTMFEEGGKLIYSVVRRDRVTFVELIEGEDGYARAKPIGEALRGDPGMN